MFLNWLREREKDEDVPEKVILTKLCTQYYLLSITQYNTQYYYYFQVS